MWVRGRGEWVHYYNKISVTWNNHFFFYSCYTCQGGQQDAIFTEMADRPIFSSTKTSCSKIDKTYSCEFFFINTYTSTFFLKFFLKWACVTTIREKKKLYRTKDLSLKNKGDPTHKSRVLFWPRLMFPKLKSKWDKWNQDKRQWNVKSHSFRNLVINIHAVSDVFL